MYAMCFSNKISEDSGGVLSALKAMLCSCFSMCVLRVLGVRCSLGTSCSGHPLLEENGRKYKIVVLQNERLKRELQEKEKHLQEYMDAADAERDAFERTNATARQQCETYKRRAEDLNSDIAELRDIVNHLRSVRRSGAIYH
jgi:hypothetical protein